MFITLEGIEGSGKTTQMGHLIQYFGNKGRQCVTTREPGGTPIGEKIRAILLNPENKDLVPQAELLLYLADRAQHIYGFFNPNLVKGLTVLCDRYFDATIVYQGYARGLDVGLLQSLHRLLFENLKPDLTFLLDLPPQAGLDRAWEQLNNGSRTGSESRFEEEKLSFHEKVRQGYLKLAAAEPQRIRIIKADQSQDQVRRDMIDILNSILD
jgi:dTMP kinase